MDEKTIKAALKKLSEDIKARDYMDEHREISPLKASPEAIIIDTTQLSFNEVLEKFYNGEKCLTTINMVNTFSNKLKLNKYNG